MLARTAVTGTMLAAVALIGGNSLARAQTAVSPTTPAEIQPGHPPPASTGSTGTSQPLTPAPLPPASGADTPGGAARNGVITPPPTADTEINRGVPSATVGTPVIPPPGSPGGNPTVVPK